ncbi:MAG: hypothetical protein CMM45_12090 [Rhodospirillaceae bacterium]|nr:hypothetical protein [Rhodospirillaceae bacterium]
MRNLLKLSVLLTGSSLIMANTNSLLSLDKIINNFGWEKRIILLIADHEDTNLIDGVEAFFAESECQNKNRNLVLHKIVGDEITKYAMPKRYEGKRGVWLIGYDGDDKAYSRDLSLLNQLYDLIDAMPVRQNEMLRQASSCD